MTANSQNFVMGDSFTIRLTMLSDWHVGTGTGIPGSIDALIARDSEGFPCVPAKTIVGMWRDALETLTLGLDGGTANAWSKWTEVIFGSQPNVDKIPNVKPRPAILALQPARLSESLRERIKSTGDLRLKQALTFLKPEIKIEEQSGTAETDMLRGAEMGRINTILETDCELSFDRIAFSENDVVLEKQKGIISALLIASSKLVERIGGKRRRGCGKCELKVTQTASALPSVVEFLKSADPSDAPKVSEESNTHEFAASDSDTSWRKLEYTLTLKTPVSIVTATLGNVSETLDFIPGTYLLPHITKGKNLFKHVANGDLQVSPATIQVGGKRGLPVPKVLAAHKVGGGFDNGKTVLNKLKDKTDESTPQLKSYRDGYVNDLDEEKQLPFYQTTPKTLLMHNTVEDDVQRPTKNVGGVYSRQAIAPTANKDGKIQATVLRGEIRFKTSLRLNFSDAGQDVRLGTSKKDDYGLAALRIENVEDANSSATGAKELVVYLESDVLLRNSNLRQTNLAPDLKGELEGKLSLNLSGTDSLIQTRRIESWHEGWGFPRPTLIAMQAGSCAKFEISGFEQMSDGEKKELNNNLQELENSGIGERRGEGYGRIRFNPKILTEAINDWAPSNETGGDGGNAKDNTPTPLESSMREFAEQIETTAWREELQRAVLLIADDKAQRLQIFGFEKGSRPSMSQIGGLRSVISRMRKFADGKYVVSWLTHLEETNNRLERWAPNQQAAKGKLGRIKDLITQDSKVWLILSEAESKGTNVWQSPPTLVRTKEELQKELWAEAVRALFDACARAHKREGGGN
jgi:CRISPR-associated protein Csx10